MQENNPIHLHSPFSRSQYSEEIKKKILFRCRASEAAAEDTKTEDKTHPDKS